jgi:hypothetical protein
MKDTITGSWYHGDLHKREDNFKEQKMDRDPTQDRNAMGPGIYWTRDPNQAGGYAGEGGYVYEAEMDIKPGRLLTIKKKPTETYLTKFIGLASEEHRETGLSNWGENPHVALVKAVQGYMESSNDLYDALCGIYNDFFGRSPEEFAKSMVKLGFDAYLHHLPKIDHLIVWNPDVIKVKDMKPYSKFTHLKSYKDFHEPK